MTDTCSAGVPAFIHVFFSSQLWVIPAFGVHPQFENGLGKNFYGFSAWFVLVNLSQPLSVFYRMHSVGALMELLTCAWPHALNTWLLKQPEATQGCTYLIYYITWWTPLCTLSLRLFFMDLNAVGVLLTLCNSFCFSLCCFSGCSSCVQCCSILKCFYWKNLTCLKQKVQKQLNLCWKKWYMINNFKLEQEQGSSSLNTNKNVLVITQSVN